MTMAADTMQLGALDAEEMGRRYPLAGPHTRDHRFPAQQRMAVSL
jgi:hypothetical protein